MDWLGIYGLFPLPLALALLQPAAAHRPYALGRRGHA